MSGIFVSQASISQQLTHRFGAAPGVSPPGWGPRAGSGHRLPIGRGTDRGAGATEKRAPTRSATVPAGVPAGIDR